MVPQGLTCSKTAYKSASYMPDSTVVHAGFRCLLCTSFRTTYLPRMRDHVSTHGRKPKQHEATGFWEECRLQTYFSRKSRIEYFVVVEGATATSTAIATATAVVAKPAVLVARDKSSGLAAAEQECLGRLEDEYEAVKDDIIEQASIVQDLGDSRSAQVPWLERTAFPSHIASLKDEEFKGSSKLPSWKTTTAKIAKLSVGTDIDTGRDKDKDKDKGKGKGKD